MLDFTNVYMDIYLPTAEQAVHASAADARIVLDAYPNFAIPAHVSFIATQAQFTPKAVETKKERDKLMFRVKVRVDPGFLGSAHARRVRTGLPGIAYVRVDPKTEWPASLRGPPLDDSGVEARRRVRKTFRCAIARPSRWTMSLSRSRAAAWSD